MPVFINYLHCFKINGFKFKSDENSRSFSKRKQQRCCAMLMTQTIEKVEFAISGVEQHVYEAFCESV